MRTPKHQVQERGLASVARSFGGAMARVRRLVPGSQPAPSGLARHGLAASPELQRRERKIRIELMRLEIRLEEQRDLIARGPLAEAMDGERRTRLLDEMIGETRRLKADVHGRREDLNRVERQIARAQRLVPPKAEVESRADTAAVSQVVETRDPGRRANAGRRARSLATALRAVRRASLAQHSERLAYQEMVEGLFGEVVEVQREMARRLGETRTRLGLDLLILAVGDSNDRVRLAVLNGMLGYKAPEAVELYRRFLADDQVLLRVTALRSLASVKGGLAGAELLDALEDSHPAMRKAAATILGWRAARHACQALVFALTDEDESVRLAAAASLGTLGDLGAVLGLIRNLGQDSAAVRAQVEASLRRLVGSAVDEVGVGLEGQERVRALKAWWRGARVDLVLKPVELPSDDAEVAVHDSIFGGAVDTASRAAASDDQTVDEVDVASVPSEEDGDFEAISGGGDADEDSAFEGGDGDADEDSAFEGIGGGDDADEDSAFEGIGGGDDVDEDGAFEGIGGDDDE